MLRQTLFILSMSGSLWGQDRWIDKTPVLEAACASVEAKDQADFGQFRQSAKRTGLTEIGSPFVVARTVDGTPRTDICAVHKRSSKALTGLEERQLPPEYAAFQFCSGADSKGCAESMISWLKVKIPDFGVPVRILPLVNSSQSKATEVKTNLAKLLVDMPDKLEEVTNRSLPEAATLLDRQLFGGDKTARPLVTQSPSTPAFEKGGLKEVGGFLVYVPISEAQKQLLQGN